jgi:hypothetical protein
MAKKDAALPMQDMLLDRVYVVKPHPENIKISPGMLGCALRLLLVVHGRWPSKDGMA